MSDVWWRQWDGWGTVYADMPNGDSITVYPCGIGRPHIWYYRVSNDAEEDVYHSRRCASKSQAKAAAVKWWRKYREGIVARMNRELREHRRRPQPYGVQEDDMAPGAAYGDI